MASRFSKKTPLVIVSGCVYVTACYIGYSSISNNKADHDETCAHLLENGNFSFITNPNRNEQYQHVAGCYDHEIGKDEAAMGINLLRKSLLYFHAQGTVLELAAGTGRNISYYPSSCDRVLMIDASENMIANARKKISELSDVTTKFACSIGDSSDLGDFPDQCFDTVVDTFGLCSYDDPVQVLKEMRRVCKSDGKILLLQHGRSKTWSFITKYLDNNAERHAKNWGCVWNRDLDKIIEDSGLEIDTLNTWHFGTTYYVVCRPNTTK